jgi:hypothetical protein
MLQARRQSGVRHAVTHCDQAVQLTDEKQERASEQPLVSKHV